MLPNVESEAFVPRPRASWWREGATLAATFALCLAGGAVHIDDTFGPPPAAAYVVAGVMCALLPLRHRAPLGALAATTLCGMLVAPLDLMLTPLVVAPVGATAYVVALRDERRTAVGALLLSAALLVSTAALVETLSWQDVSRLGTVAAVPLVAGVLGRSVHNRRAYLGAVEERARRAEKTRESEARRRVAEERVRIARELHDLVAHQITLANAQAVVAAHLFDAHPEQTRKGLDDLIETTRNALDDLRATVGLLRQSGDAVAPTEPTPGLSQLPALLESFRRAGLEVSVDQKGTARPLPPGADLTAYRIIQEALTNVTKHAGAGSARVRLVWNRHRLAITVADDGKDARNAPHASTGQRLLTLPDRPPGYGLIGMRERAAAVGGQLSAGRSPEGGFLVSTHLPLPPVRNMGASDGTPDADGRMADATAGDGRASEAEVGPGIGEVP
ncbi:sensor histidine kinase [Phytohabitans flavus]|uniref:sensor histidine kinase n=1 Tax=Phytohabitans flavus TaxID=1076124 RepID=UPI001E5E9366|nr:histidine kinase [Phytohabitans flavus]